MTFNIRLNLASDSLNAWPYRKDKVALHVLFMQTVILGVQEALPEQMNDLHLLLKRYRSIGVGREDGKNKGEFSAIFYDTTLVALTASGTFWLSETPFIAGSKGWDAALPRIVTWGKFTTRNSQIVFFLFNTHFDHMGKEARRQSSRLLLKMIDSIAGSAPVIAMGDFNALPDEEPIRVITDPANPLHLVDTRDISILPHFGPDGSFNGWKTSETGNLEIDHIFCNDKIGVLRHGTLSQVWGTRFSSDHFPVMAELLLP